MARMKPEAEEKGEVEDKKETPRQEAAEEAQEPSEMQEDLPQKLLKRQGPAAERLKPETGQPTLHGKRLKPTNRAPSKPVVVMGMRATNARRKLMSKVGLD